MKKFFFIFGFTALLAIFDLSVSNGLEANNGSGENKTTELPSVYTAELPSVFSTELPSVYTAELPSVFSTELSSINKA